jgi:hypothetical protein
MAFASHANDQVLAELRAGIVPTKHPLVFGQFRHNGYTFEYAERRDFADDFAPDMPHMIYVGPLGETRLAKVMKTVAWVVVDEDDKGQPVYAQWKLSSHRIYDTAWVRA